jgi:TPP-dependent pyruvate/acetoin dehydrogenase alpha subunit
MLHIRLVEDTILKLRMSGTVVGSVHLSNGQEAIPVGVIAVKRAGDPVFATYRGHGWALACGVPTAELIGEICGREIGLNGGRGGSAYLSAPDYDFYGENSIVGAGAAHAVGAALAGQYDGSSRVAVAVFGDGAMNQGAVHEAMNLAAVMNLAVVFVCENNRYSELTPIAAMVRNPVLADRAAAYGMPGVRVDGNDPEAVSAIASEAFDRARGGGGPTLIEAMTQRLVGHYVGDPEIYRAPGEVKAAYLDEPLIRSRRRMTDAGISSAEIAALEERIRSAVDAAAAEALSSPLAPTDDVAAFVYG